MRKLILLAAALLLVPSVSEASSLWAKCGASSVSDAANYTTGADRSIAAGESECFYFNADEDSDVFYLFAPSTLICLDPDVSTEGAATATVMVRHCASGTTVASVNRCFATLNGDGFDGTTGDDGVQNSCKRYGPGAYYIENTTSAATDEAVVSVRGEGG